MLHVSDYFVNAIERNFVIRQVTYASCFNRSWNELCMYDATFKNVTKANFRVCMYDPGDQRLGTSSTKVPAESLPIAERSIARSKSPSQLYCSITSKIGINSEETKEILTFRSIGLL